jgi:orotidine-5'-phosphate decarboxylase
LPWLMPGIGFQGGNLKESISIGEKNFLPLVNVSRGILRSGDGSITSIRNATEKYTGKIREIL